MSERCFIVHGHFYQPPREDPWTGKVPRELGAAPYVNFNEKITEECYRPNAVLGNLDLMSFNFGPTLLRWLASYAEDTYQRIVDADLWHVDRFGVGNGMGQGYNHTILPLATRQDKRTQVAWAIADFEDRFGRRPQGMWLPEMAVDYETLDVLAEYAIRYTVLSTSQSVDGVDSCYPHEVHLHSGHSVAVFFRQDWLSNIISFRPEETVNATTFADQHLAGAVPAGGDAPMLLLAMDGETFGHHQSLRQHFLQALLQVEIPRVGYTVCSPARYLWEHPPQRNAEIVQNSAWSCAHGLARWSEGCSCTPGDSRWKGILRRALDGLAGRLDALYEEAFRSRGLDPWSIRDRYIAVMLGQMKAPDFLREWAGGGLTQAEEGRLLRLLAAQPARQEMYTSCGWFFEDLGRLETRYIMGNAARAAELTAEATGVSLIEEFRQDLSSAESWITDETGAEILDRILTTRSQGFQ